MRAKKLTAGGAVTQNSNAGTNVGGDPQWQTNKPTAANAKDGNYQFFLTATLTRISGPDLVPEIGKYYSTYEGQVVLKGKVGSTWTTLATRTVTRSYSTTEAEGSASHTATRSFSIAPGAMVRISFCRICWICSIERILRSCSRVNICPLLT